MSLANVKNVPPVHCPSWNLGRVHSSGSQQCIRAVGLGGPRGREGVAAFKIAHAGKLVQSVARTRKAKDTKRSPGPFAAWANECVQRAGFPFPRRFARGRSAVGAPGQFQMSVQPPAPPDPESLQTPSASPRPRAPKKKLRVSLNPRLVLPRSLAAVTASAAALPPISTARPCVPASPALSS